MPTVIEISTGKKFDLASDQAQTLLSHPSGDYRLAEGDRLTVKTSGYTASVAPEVAGAIGATPETGAERGEREEEARVQDEYGGIGGRALTALTTVGDELGMGAVSAGARLFGLDDELSDMRKANPGTHTAFGVGTTALTALATGGGSLLKKGLIGRAARATPLGAAMTAGTKIGGAKGLALESALISGGQGVQDVMLSEDPLTVERFAAEVGSDMLYGAGFGGAMGGAGKLLSVGVAKSKKLVDKANAARSKGASLSDDLAKMDKQGLQAAERAASRELGEEVVTALRRSLDDESTALFRATSGESKAVINMTRNKQRGLGRHLKDPVGLAENPMQAKKLLRMEEQVLKSTLENPKAALASLVRADIKVAKELAEELAELAPGGKIKLKGAHGALYGDVRDIAVRKAGITIKRGDLAKFMEELQGGAAARMRKESMDLLPAALEANRRNQALIASIEHKTAPNLAEIDRYMDALKAPAEKAGLIEQTVQGGVFTAATALAAPFGLAAPLIGGKVSGKITDFIFRRGSKVTKAAGERSTSAVDAFLDVGRKLGKAANPAATKILASTAFGPEPGKMAQAMAKRGVNATKPKTLLDAFQRRSAEVLAQVQQGANGPVMRTGARLAMAARLDGVREADPVLADRLETHAARRIEFLASKLPKRPGLSPMMTGPDLWRASDMAMRQWARHVAAAEDPGGVEERVADGTVTPEDVETMRELYPERWEDFKNQIIMRLPELRAQLPYSKRLTLSIFTGVPVDPALNPAILKILQANHSSEPNTDGGTSAPTPQPQFGSVSKPEMTPAQERAQ